MRSIRRGSAVLAFALFATLLPAMTAGAAEFHVLIDSVRDAGCTVAGMPGVDHVVITKLSADAATVSSLARRTCNGSALGPEIAIPFQTGWAVGSSNGTILESIIPLSELNALGITPTTKLRLGFAFTADPNSVPVFLAGPIFYPPKTHIVNLPKNDITIVLDGKKPEWAKITPFHPGTAAGSSGFTLSAVSIVFLQGNLYFLIEGSGLEGEKSAKNEPPTASPESFSTSEDTPLTITPPGVLGNDTDPEGQALQAQIDSSTTNGTLTLNPVDGSFTYSPNPDFNGVDSFQYHAVDDVNASSNTVTDTITISEVNDSPTAVGDSLTTAEDSPLIFPASNLTANDDPGPNEGGQTLTVIGVSPTSTQGGTVTLVAGVITYTPAPNFNGTDTFSYTIQDNGTTNGSSDFKNSTGTVTVTVTPVVDPPVLTVTGAAGYTENGAAVNLASTANIVDADDVNMESATIQITGNFTAGQDVLQFTNTPNITGSFAGSTLTLTGTDTKANYIAALLAVRYLNTSDSPSTLARTITWTVNDGDVNSNTQTTTLTVTAVNDAPVNTLPVAQTTGEDTPLTLTGVNKISVSDVDANPNDVQVTLNVTNGVVSLNAGALAGLTSVTGNGTNTVVATGTVTNVNLALDGLTFTPTANFNGPASIQVVTNDLAHNPAPALSDTDTLSITVTAVNDAPVLTVTGAVTHTEGGAATNVATAANITDVDDTNMESATIQITGNFAAGQDVLQFTNTPNITGSFAGSTLTLTGTDTLANYIAALQAVRYTNTSDTPSTLTRTLTWTVNDGTANSNTQTSTVGVTATNDAPVNNLPAAQNTNEDTPLTLTGANKISISDVDANPDDVQVTLNVTNGTVTLNPLATGALTNLTGNGTNTVVATGTVANINAALDGLVFSPTLNYFGAASIQVVTDDLGNNPSGNLTDTDTLAITVNPVNDAPVLTVTGAVTHTEGGAATNVATAANITDVDDTNMESATIQITGNFASGQDVLQFTNTPNISGSFVGDTLTLTGTDTIANYIAALQAVQYTNTSDTPSTLQRTLTWKVNDGSLDSNTQTTTVGVTATNDAPVNNLPAAQNTNEDTPLTLSSGGGNAISISDVDANPDDVQVTLNVTNGTVTLNPSATGALTTLTGDGTNTVVATGTIAEINAALDGLVFTPTLDYNGGGASIQVVTDDLGNNPSGNLTDTDTLTITVNAVNDAPVLTITGAVTHTEGGAATNVATAANITDVDDTNIESATIQITGNFAAGQDVLSFVNTPNISGSFVGNTLTLTGTDTKAAYIAALLAVQYTNTSNAPSTLTRTLTWKVNDGTVDSNTQTSTVDVTATNDAPVNNVPGTQSTNEDTPLSLGALVTISDPDSDPDDVQITLNITNGTVTLNPSATGALTSLTGDGTGTVVAQGTVSEINAALNNASFSPTLDFNGTATIQIVTDDLGNNPSGNLTDTDSFNITVNAVNDAPVLTLSGAPTFAENGPAVNAATSAVITDVDDTNMESATVQITGNFQSGSDVLSFVNTPNISGSFVGDTLTLTGTDTKAAYAAALLSVQFSNTSDNPVTLQRTLTWKVNDGSLDSNTQTSTVSVTATNDPPVNTVPGTQTINEDTPALLGSLVSIADPDSDPDDVQVTLNITNGTLTLNSGATGALTSLTGDGTGTVVAQGTVSEINAALNNSVFSPALNFTGTATIQIVTDDLGNNPSGNLTDTDSFNINVLAVNDPPVNNVPGPQTINEDTTLTFTGGNAITISDVDATTAQVQLTATNGTLTLGSLVGLSFTVGDGTADTTMTFTGNITDINTALNGLVYAPNLNVNGAQSVTIVTNDQGNTGSGGAQSDTDSITVNVTAVNDAPVNTVPAGTQTMNQDSVLTFTGATQISVADVDAGGNSIQVQLTGTNGTITLSGTAGLSFSVGDGTADATMTFTGTIAAINTALNNLQFASSPGFFSGANATLQIVTDDLGFTGTPGALQDSDTIQIFVQQVNQAPVNTVPGAQTFNEDTTRTFSSGNSNQISIADPDAGAATVQVQLTVANGTLTLNGVAGLSFVFSDGNGTGAGDGTADATMTFRGTIANINTALNGLVYTPNLNFNGTDTLAIVTNDLGNTGPGGPQTDSDNVTLNITAVNDAPVITRPATATVAEDAVFTFNAGNVISVADVDAGAGQVQVQLSVSNGTVSLSGVAGLSFVFSDGNGTGAGDGTADATMTFRGTLTNVNNALNNMTYQGTLNFNGSDTLNINANDLGNSGTGGPLTDSKSTAITITAQNDAPVNTVPGLQTFNEDTTLTFSTGNGNAISVADVDAASGNVTVTLTTTAGTMTFGSVAGLSAVTNNAATITGTGTLANVNNALQGLVFTPTLNINGAQTIGLTTSDNGNTGAGGTLTDVDTINLSITAVNDAPVITRPATITATEDVAFTFNGGNTVSVADVDAGAGSVQVQLTVTNGTLSLSGTAGLSFVFSDGNGTGAGDGTSDATMTFRGTLTNVNNALNNMTYLGNSNFNGSDTLNINVSDLGNTGTGGVLTDSKSTGITVTAVNDPPVAQPQTYQAQAHMKIIGLGNVLTGATDPDNGTGPGPCVSTTFTVGTITPVTGGTVSNINTSAGTFDFSPAAGFVGAATLNYTIVDTGCPGPGATSAPATITINVAGPAIYFVKSVAVGTGDCTLGNECTLATAVPLATAAANRHIFISDANTHNPGVATITLNTGGHLMGQGVTPPVDGDGVLTNDFDDLFDITPPTGTIARPPINAVRPTVMNTTVALNTNSQLRGLNMNIQAGSAVTSTGKTGLKITDMNTVSNTNAAGTFAIDLNTSSGDFTLGTVSINAGRNGSGVRFATTTSTNPVTIGTITTEGGQGFSSSSTGATNFSFTNVTSTTGAAVTTATSTGNFSFNNVSSTTGAAVTASGTGGGNFTFNNVTSTTGAAVTTSTTGTSDFTFNDVTSTTGTAVSVTTGTGDFIFHAINSNGGAKGISVNSLNGAGTFTVNGTSTTDATGGTIQNKTSRGAEFISSDNITLKNMNFTNNGVGGSDANCADALGATTTGTFVTNATCESNLHLQTVTSATLNNLNIMDGDSHGINGYQVNGLSMTNMDVERNGDEVGEDGVQLVNPSGTISLTGSNIFKDNGANQFEAQSGTGSATFNISGAFFGLTNFPTTGVAEPPSPGPATLNNGLQISASGSANITTNVTGCTFDQNYADGYFSDYAGTSVMSVNVGTNASGNIFTNNGIGIEVGGNSTGAMTYFVQNNTITNNTTITGAFTTTATTFSRSGNGATWTGTIDNNTIGTNLAGSTYSGCFVANCAAMEITDTAALNTNTYHVNITNNKMYHVQFGVRVTLGGGLKKPKNSTVMTGNTIKFPDVKNPPGADTTAEGNAIHIDSGTIATDEPQVCTEIGGAGALANTIDGAWGDPANHDSIRLRYRNGDQPGEVFRVRNWDGTGGSAGMLAFVESTNTITVPAGYDKSGFQLGTGAFTGGAGACP